MKTGTVCWYDKRDKRGIIVDAKGNEYYTDISVIVGRIDLNAKQTVQFTVKKLADVWCAQNVRLL